VKKMNDKQTKEVSAAEWLGLFALFLPGSFFVVVLGAALLRGVPAEPAGTSALARAVMDGVGLLPALLLSAGFAVVGIRSFLFGRGANALTSVLGLTGCAAGLAMLAGAAVPGAGGTLGAGTGGLLASSVGSAVGIILGAVVIAGSTWFAWIRDIGWFSTKTWNFRWVSAAPREECADAVTADEAEALLPTRPTYAPETETTEGTWQEPSSSYPADVRLSGEVPAGAQALDTDDGFERTNTGTREVASVQSEVDEDGPSSVDAPDAHLAADEVEERAAADREDDAADEALSDGESGTGRPLDQTPLRPTWEREEVEAQDSEDDSELEDAAELEEEDGEEEEFEEEEDSEELEDAAELDEEDGEEEELEEEEDSEELEDAAELDEEDGEEEEFEEEEDSEELEDAAELDEEEGEEEEPEVEEDSEELEDAAELDEEEGEEEEPEEEEDSEEPAGDPQRDLFGEPVMDDGEPADAGEREVVLEPQPAPELAGDLLIKAGCLFLERERVAVSMLQRGFDLTFDQSCHLLDELQEQGLIGPYMGGKSREILMSREEWLALADGS
jgi:DNA segregation ATPase FtsK/SpoIIIE-like protein